MTTKTIVEYKSKNGARCLDMGENNIDVFGPKWQASDQNFLSCTICGRNTSKQGKSVGVIVSDGGAAIVFPGDNLLEQSDGGYMGWFPVGSECIKAIPAEFRIANIYENKVKGV
jgi:hypothetical protein